MNLLKHKLHILNQKKIFIRQENNINIDDLKLTIYNSQKNINLCKTPQKLRNIISLNKLEKKIDTSYLNSRDFNFKGKKNDENDLIRQFLYQKINYKKFLKPIKIIRRSNSTVNLNNQKSHNFFKENNKNDKTNNKSNRINNNMTFLLFNKFNKNFNGNQNINKITKINRYLIKDNENNTNGNIIYDDYNEEKKETITFIIKSNNLKEFYKKNLTKRKKENEKLKKNINNECLEDFKFYSKRFDCPALNNIKKIKYLQALMQQKNKDKFNNIEDNKGKDKSKDFQNINNYKYFYILKNKIHKINCKIDYTGRHLRQMDNKILSCLVGAKYQFDTDTKNIFGEDYLK